MGRVINKLTVKETVRDLAPGSYGDGGGLYLQVSKLDKRKTKAWVFQFMIAGRARKMGLGDYERISLKGARWAAGAGCSEARHMARTTEGKEGQCLVSRVSC